MAMAVQGVEKSLVLSQPFSAFLLILGQPFSAFLLILRLPRSAFLLILHLPRSAFLLILHLQRSAFLSKLCPKILAQSLNCRQQIEERPDEHRQKRGPNSGEGGYYSPNFRAHTWLQSDNRMTNPLP